jgi:inner membrane protein
VRTTDDYQKSTRSVKYAILVIGLTFLVFFLVEIMNGKRIHPFQYTLVGFALCIFYVLLISISEHLEFNLAYFISAGVVILMITLYALAIFKSKKLTSMLFIILTGLYGFIFVLLQASDYALLMGSAGLVVTLSLTMYLTRNINWYSIRPKAE